MMLNKMSLNQLYDDLKPDLEVGSTSNYKFNNIRTKTFQTTEGSFNNVITTYINGQLPTGGGLPPILPANENSIMSVKSGSATWTDDVIITDGGSFVINPTADMNCYGPSSFYNDVDFTGNTTFVNFTNGAQLNLVGGGIDMSGSQNLLNTVSTTVNGGVTYLSNHDIQLNNSSVISAGANVSISVPSIKFIASGLNANGRLSFYKSELIAMQLVLVPTLGADVNLQTIDVNFTRIGRVIQMNIKNTVTAALNASQSTLKIIPITPFPDYFKPAPLFSALINVNVVDVNNTSSSTTPSTIEMQGDGSMYITSGVSGHDVFLIVSGNKIVLGLRHLDGSDSGGISVSYTRFIDA
jgi:hypothetical protein